VRLLVYTDYKYRTDGERVYAEKAFATFLIRVVEGVDGAVVAGRLNPERGSSHYPLPASIEFVPLPWYPALSRPRAAIPAMVRSLRHFWRALDRVDTAWLLGPYLLSIAFALLAAIRRRRVILGVRQDLPTYTRARHPGRPLLHVAGDLLDLAYRLMARRCATIVVGPHLGERYRHACRLLTLTVSLVREADIAPPAVAEQRRYDGEIRILSVGRLEQEKNPLLLADVLSRLHAQDDRFRLIICGDGPLREVLAERLRDLGVAAAAEFRGYVPWQDLMDIYHDSHVLLHISWTEGLPQVLYEAFAARLPTVATGVGGVPAAAAGCAELIPPGDAKAAAEALLRVVRQPELRRRLTDAAVERVRAHTVEAEAARVRGFVADRAPP
jgi:glycosyltransferase involved in cell wall biosynthesis